MVKEILKTKLSPRSGRHRKQLLMGHTYSNNLYHIIFSTKDRVKILTDRYREETHKYLCGVARSLDCTVLDVNSVEDHVHLLAKIKPSISVSEFTGKLKANSSRWFKKRFSPPTGFQWQSGFSSFTVSESSVDDVKKYIRGQEQHHRTVTFKDELKVFFQKALSDLTRYLFSDSACAPKTTTSKPTKTKMVTIVLYFLIILYS